MVGRKHNMLDKQSNITAINHKGTRMDLKEYTRQKGEKITTI